MAPIVRILNITGPRSVLPLDLSFTINMTDKIRPDARTMDQEIESQEQVKLSPDAAQNRQKTPLPTFQLFLVLLIQFSEPTTATVIYPFLNQFVRDTGITQGDDRETGYYAGVIVSLLHFGQQYTG